MISYNILTPVSFSWKIPNQSSQFFYKYNGLRY